MKKVIVVLLIMIFICPMPDAFAKSKKKKASDGYYGSLPAINSQFEEYKQEPKETNPPIILNEDSFHVDEKELKAAPLNNTDYVDVIIKKSTASNYVNEINELVPILKKLRTCIEEEQDIQKFNAIVSNYIDNVVYIEKKYKDKPEYYYFSFEKIVDMAKYAKKVAITRTEAQVYNKYLSYEDANGAYSPSNIKRLLENTLSEIEITLEVIKEAK